MMTLMDKAKSLRDSIEDTYKEAYAALQGANITLGVIENIARSIPVENGISVSYRSVMGVDIPKLTLKRTKPKCLTDFIQLIRSLTRRMFHFQR